MIKQFEQSKLAIQQDAPVRWNDYVFSTIAFLQKNKETLMHYRDEIANKGKSIQGIIPNLSIVENMIANMELSYAEVYRMPIILPPRQGVNL